MKKCCNHIAVMIMLTVLFFSSFPITALADEEISVTELSATGEITSDVNVRKGPGTDYEKIGTVRAGDTVTVTGQSHDGWYRIEFQGTEGFVYGQYMTIVSTVADPGNPENVQEQQADPEETEEDTHLGTGIFKTAAIVVIIAVIIVMIILTLKSMRHDDTADSDDDEEDDSGLSMTGSSNALTDYFMDQAIADIADASTQKEGLGIAQMLYESMKRNG